GCHFLPFLPCGATFNYGASMRRLLLTALLVIASSAAAQVTLPTVRLPQLPAVTLPDLPASVPLDIEKSAAALAGETDPRRLRELRALRIRELLRRHRDVLEADPRGAPVVRGEVLALSPSATTLEAAAAAGFTVLREQSLGDLGARLVVLRVPGKTARALARLKALDPAGIYDFNHVYTDSGAALAAGTGAVPPATPGGAPHADGGERSATRIGLIDSGVDVTHEVFNGITIQQHGCGTAVPAEHGTAVASLMVGRASTFHGAAPGSALYAADVFCGRPTGGAVDAVAEAFGWLAREHVPVINVSLVGPPNTMLAALVRFSHRRRAPRARARSTRRRRGEACGGGTRRARPPSRCPGPRARLRLRPGGSGAAPAAGARARQARLISGCGRTAAGEIKSTIP